MKRNFRTFAARLIATGLGSGYLPKSPGTCGSLALVCVWVALHEISPLNPWVVDPILVVVITVIGLLATRVVVNDLDHSCAKVQTSQKEKSDPQEIVIDEWAGMAIALLGIDVNNWVLVLSAFLLFRIFDILKPGPIRAAERLPGAWGIMADDLLAGGIARLCLALLFRM